MFDTPRSVEILIKGLTLETVAELTQHEVSHDKKLCRKKGLPYLFGGS
jgi:hypothetical protein